MFQYQKLCKNRKCQNWGDLHMLINSLDPWQPHYKEQLKEGWQEYFLWNVKAFPTSSALVPFFLPWPRHPVCPLHIVSCSALLFHLILKENKIISVKVVFQEMEEKSSHSDWQCSCNPRCRLPGSHCNILTPKLPKLQDPFIFLLSAPAKQRVKLSCLSYSSPPLSCLEGRFRK